MKRRRFRKLVFKPALSPHLHVVFHAKRSNWEAFRFNLFKQYQCFSVMNNFLERTIARNSTCWYFYFCAPPAQGLGDRISFSEKAEPTKAPINLWYSRGALDREDRSSNNALMAAICWGHCGYGWPKRELGGWLTAVCFRFGVEITEEELELPLDRIPLDEDGNAGDTQLLLVFGFVFSHPHPLVNFCSSFWYRECGPKSHFQRRFLAL